MPQRSEMQRRGSRSGGTSSACGRVWVISRSRVPCRLGSRTALRIMLDIHIRPNRIFQNTVAFLLPERLLTCLRHPAPLPKRFPLRTLAPSAL